MTTKARFNVLVTSGNQGLGASTIDVLNPGQVGFFNAVTHTNITSKVEAERDGFYIVLGVDKDNDGNIDDTRRNYNKIFPKNFVSYTQKCYQAYQPKIIRFKGCIISFDTDYLLKLDFRNNSLYVTNGQIPADKLIAYRTEPCPDTATCQHPDIAKMYKDILSQVNDDKQINSFVSVIATDPSTDTPIADLDTWCAANPGVAPGLEFTIDKPKFEPVLTELQDYVNPREFETNLYGMAGFEANGTVSVPQDMIFEETSGREVMELERIAGGWDSNPGVYRELSVGTKNIRYLATKAGKYTLITIFYKTVSESGQAQYTNDESVVFAIPDGDTTTVQEIRERLGLLITDSATGFGSNNC